MEENPFLIDFHHLTYLKILKCMYYEALAGLTQSKTGKKAFSNQGSYDHHMDVVVTVHFYSI